MHRTKHESVECCCHLCCVPALGTHLAPEILVVYNESVNVYSYALCLVEISTYCSYRRGADDFYCGIRSSWLISR